LLTKRLYLYLKSQLTLFVLLIRSFAHSQVALSRKSPYVQTPHKVSGMMLANHTCMQELFRRSLNSFDKMRKRNAYLSEYQKQPMFADNLDEFDNSREIVQSVMDEYKASETPDYVNWGEDSKEAVVPGLTC
jgi:tubulin gamma